MSLQTKERAEEAIALIDKYTHPMVKHDITVRIRAYINELNGRINKLEQRNYEIVTDQKLAVEHFNDRRW